jgi:ABC-2 type transport system permease protein
MLYVMRSSGSSDVSGELPASFLRACRQGLTAGECFQVYFVQQFMFLFMLTPLIVPVNIAAYSIVGEKTTHSLEPLLATPITTPELLTGKNLAAAIPAVLATWLSFLVFSIGARLMVSSANVIAALFDPMWWLAVLVVGPLLSILSVNFSLMVSSRVNDPRVAEQLSAVIILPLLVLFFGQIGGLVFLNRQLMLALALALVAIDALVVYLAIQLFQRETILTRWK